MRLSRRQFLALAAALPGCELAARAGLRAEALDGGPRVAPVGDTVDAVSHALNRLTFGPRPGDYARVSAMGVEAYIEEQLAPERIDDGPCERRLRRLESLDDAPGDLFEYKPEFLQAELSRGALLRAVYSRRQLQEVMVEFWTDHFNIDVSKGDCRWLKAADDRDVVRRHALGMFPALLRASALSPAMLWYLDGRANRRARGSDMPNENYARELMELHTLGIDGGYTQRDVMEVARCLTGWTVRSEERFGKGRVEFRPKAHDDGEKVVLGHVIRAGGGAGDLDRVLDIVAFHRATARHIASKLCRKFISEEPPEAAVEATAAAFTRTGGDIRATLRAMFATRAFVEARGTKLKRPFRFVASALRATGADTDGGAAVLDYLQRMGHAPYQYPTPDGYPDEAQPWLGTLLWRWHFAAALAEGAVAGTRVDWGRLAAGFGGPHGLLKHFWGRQPSEDEREVLEAASYALALASPAFQRH